MKPLISLAAVAVALGCSGAQAQYTDGTIRIGVLNDMSGTYSDLSGRGSLIAARMAVEDFGAAAKGMKVEIRTSRTSGRISCASGSTPARST
jgi:branched-chain amino acid transport system substrate-binding protein